MVNDVHNKLTRRSLLARAGIVAGALVVASERALPAADLPHLSSDDPVASALGYTEDATKVDPRQSPNYQAGEKCANCMQNSGAPGQAWGPCKVFAGKLVSESGWCRAYVRKG